MKVVAAVKDIVVSASTRVLVAATSVRVLAATVGAGLMAAAVEVGVFVHFKNFLEALGVADNNAKSINKAFSEEINVTDDLDGAISTLDDQTVSVFKVKNNTVALDDTFYRQASFVRAYDEDLGITDTSPLGVQKPFTESLELGDTQTKIISKVFFENVQVSNVVDYSKYFFRGPDEGFAVTETSARGTDKGLADSAGLADAGSMIVQSYVQNGLYFATNYTGTTYSF